MLKPFGLALGLSVSLSCASDVANAPLPRLASSSANAVIGPVLIITEIMANPAAVADDLGEWFEVYNAGDQSVNLQGYQIRSGPGSPSETHTIGAAVVVPSGGYAVIGNNANSAINGGVTVAYAYPGSGTGAVFLNNSSTDWIALRKPDGSTADSVSYSGRNATGAIVGPNFTPSSNISRVITLAAGQHVGTIDNATIGGNAAWANTPVGVLYNTVDRGTPGTGTYSTIQPPEVVVARVDVSPTSESIAEGGTVDFDAQAFDAAGDPVTVSFSWSSSLPSVAEVDAEGTATGRAFGETQIRATAGGVTGSAVLTVLETPLPNLPVVRFSEIHYDNVETDVGEAIEIEAPAGTDLTGWSVVLYNGGSSAPAPYNTRMLNGIVPDLCSGRGVVVVRYEQDGVQNGGNDGFALINAAGEVVEFLSYEGTLTAASGPAAGTSSTDIGAAQASAPHFQTLQRRPSGRWEGPKPSTLGGCYGSTPVVPHNQITFSGRVPFDLALPVGFEDQLFATLRTPSNNTVPTTITWTSETPAIATIDARGVMHALGAGTATFRATAADGTTQLFSLPMQVGAEDPTALYGHNTEFGIPTDGDASDDFIVARKQFTSSFNHTRNIPNWVSYNIDQTHFEGVGEDQDRCDCFTYDPLLPFTRYTTADYTGAGGYITDALNASPSIGLDRGHLARSFDRTAGVLDNAATFYFSNIIPQFAANNQGPWAQLENHIGAFARSGDKEVFVVTGASGRWREGSLGTVKGEGLITIPAFTWKVAVIMPRDQGRDDIDSYDDVEIIAVLMPNEPVVNSDWRTYQTSINAIELLSGYDLLALMPRKIGAILETGMQDEMRLIDQFVTAGKLNRGNGNSLQAKLEAAAAAIERGETATARNQLEAMLREIAALDNKRLPAADANALSAAVMALIASLAT